MKVRYKSLWSTVMLGLAGASILVGIAGLVLVGKFYFGTWFPGVLCLIVGLGYRNRPYFELNAGELAAPAAIGPLVKRYPFTAITQVEVRDGRVWVAGEKTGLSASMADKGDWQAFETHLGAEAFD